jgi:alpha-D-ribose 1-methylphosphonate 5-triphosphate diphosphatase
MEIIPGRKIQQHYGLVQGSSVRAKHVGRDIMASLKNIFGGELKGYTELLHESREEAVERMTHTAQDVSLKAAQAAEAAALAHDNQIAGSGITTVYDAIAVGGLRESSLRAQILKGSVEAICEGVEKKLFKADHFLHLRCEVGDSGMDERLETYGNCPKTKLVSVMDHTPGQRQWRDFSKWRQYHKGKQWSDNEAQKVIDELKKMQQLHGEKNRQKAISFAKERNITLASHDDTTVQDAKQAAEEGIGIAEFPTTLEAAQTAKSLGMKTIMGAPNAVRGGSHSGNVRASKLAEENLLDGLSSDYVPNSLLHSAFHLSQDQELPLNKTIGMVSANIAAMVGLTDRGELTAGKMADIVQVKMVDSLPIVRKVWKRGTQVG